MNKLIIHLDSKEERNPQPKTAVLWNPAMSSGVGALLLIGFFTFIFASTFFLVENTGGGVFAQQEGDQHIASLAGASLEELEDADPVEVILYKDPFENIQIEAEAAYVFDTASGNILYEKNKNTVLPLASVTKVMTALAAREVLADDDIVTVRSEDISVEGSSGLVTGEQWKFKDILDFTLVGSSNDGASAIAAAAGEKYKQQSTSSQGVSSKSVFIKHMNATARKLGMEHTTYNNETGLDITNAMSGGHGTAYDMGLLYAYILKNHPALLEATRKDYFDIVSADSILHTARNTNQEVVEFSGLIGSKTGYTDLAGGNLAVMFDSGLGTPIIVVVLGSSIEGRFEDVAMLSEAAREAVSQDLF